ncbi:MAG: glycosyltransferase family A protein [Gemmatimonadota bacterium]
MSTERKIVGISLLRNEEYFAFWSIANAVDFCDEFLVVDNQSDDRTGEKLEALRALHPRITIHKSEDPNTSHRYIQDYAGEDVWIFGVDGDEIYDPEGLARLRLRILSGEFDAHWCLAGYMLHAVRMDLEAGQASGYISPHTPRGTKLYNFGLLESWVQPDRERLHGHSMKFRPGHSKKDVFDLFAEAPWEACDMRCVHLCFFPRSSADTVAPVHRKNPFELRARGVRKLHNYVKSFLATPFSSEAGYKTRRYRRGEIVTRDITAFGQPDRWAPFDPQANEAERVLSIPRG